MDKLAEGLAELAAQYGPATVDAALGAVRVACVVSLLRALPWFGLAALALLLRWGLHGPQLGHEDDDDHAIRLRIRQLAACVAVFVTFIGVCVLLNPWAWVGLFRPDLWLAGTVLKL